MTGAALALLLGAAAPGGAAAADQLAAQIGCPGARIDWPSLGQEQPTIIAAFPRRACQGIAAGEAGLFEWRGRRWYRLAVLDYDRGANRNGRGNSRHAYRFANDHGPSADMWIADGKLIVMRGPTLLVRRTLHPNR